MKHIAIFASGTGSNATKIVEYFADNENIQVSLIVSNKADAAVLDMAEANDIPTHVISRTEFYKTEDILKTFKTYYVDFVVLAGFLWLIPSYLVESLPNRIVNIHPALLPSYGGKGMYGMNVHRAVQAAGERESGMTIHFVNVKYDEGDIIFQAKTKLLAADTPEDIQRKVLKLEHKHYAEVVDEIVTKLY
ncbi:MAG: phosphoribosylglycinamide formyltransferase-1 [Saprospiraceae bacterium]|jgi:phosphoribosylglycinamide formyltransferase-1